MTPISHSRHKKFLLPLLLVLLLFTSCGTARPAADTEDTGLADDFPIVGDAAEGGAVAGGEPEFLTDWEITGLEAITLYPASVLDAPGGDVLCTLPAGETVYLTDCSGVLWNYGETDDGAEGYFFTGDLALRQEDGTFSTTDAAQDKIARRLAELQAEFPSGKYWNHMGIELEPGADSSRYVTDIPCDHDVYGELYCNVYNGQTLELFPQYDYLCQCLGFASMISDDIFGADAPVYLFYDYDQLQVGDQIRYDEYEHSMIVISKTDEYVTVAEVNADYQDCLIEWGRKITRQELAELSWDSEYISRYPLSRDGTRTLLTDDEATRMQADVSFSEDGEN